MIRHFPPWILVLLIFIVFLAQTAAEYWHLYFYYWWIDIPLHVLGGLWIALSLLASYYAFAHPENNDYSAVFVVAFAIATALGIGLFWEIYEFGIDHAVGDTGRGLADTLKDLVDDLVGGIFAAWIFIHFGYNTKQ